LWQKICLILFGICIFFILIEVGFRIVGFILALPQQIGNQESGDNTYRILCLGDSTTQSLGQSSWPSQLETILNNRSPNIQFKVFNEGRGGAPAILILTRLENYLTKYQPDMVITMMGVHYGDSMFEYFPSLGTKASLFFQDLKIVKLYKWIIAVWEKQVKLTRNTVTETNKSEQNSKKEQYRIVNKPANFDLVEQYRSEGKFSEAITLLETELETDPHNDLIFAELGINYYELGNQTIAIQMWETALDLNPDNYEANVFLAEFNKNIGRYDESEKFFLQAINSDELHDAAYLGLGVLYRDMGRFGESETFVKKSIEIGPENWKKYDELASLYWGQEQTEQSVDTFIKAYKLNPTHDGLLIKIGDVLLQSGVSHQEIHDFYIEQGLPLKVLENIDSYEATKRNYLQLHQVLTKRSIEHIAMQYPTLSLDQLKEMLASKDVIFIGNDQNFKEALGTGNYNDYFSDSFGTSTWLGGKWGHCTAKGNTLIAENLANVILEELEIEG